LALAQIAEKRGELAQANAWLDKIRNPQDLVATQNRRASILARQGRMDEARALIRALPERQPGDARTKLLAETQLLREHKQFQAAFDLLEEAAKRQHTPKVAFVAKPADYIASSGKEISAKDINVLVRAMSMGKLHHAMMGTAAVAIGTAAAIPGTLVNLAAGGGNLDAVRFGHPSGTLRVGAQAVQVDGEWQVTKAIMSRSARVLMEGWVRVPG
jgi:2-methylaconitate cis-trans-isomerase PrpF